MKFELFYVNYGIALFASSIILALAFGLVSSGEKGEDSARVFTDDFSTVEASKFIYAIIGGAVFNVANLLLCKGIDMLGLALAFPLCIGTSLVGGTILNYIISPGGNAALLFTGAAVAFLAVCATAYLNAVKDQQLAVNNKVDDVEAKLTDSYEPSMARKLLVCIVGGLIMSCWSPFVTLATKTDGDNLGLTPFTEFIFFTLAVLVTNFALVPMIISCPIEGGAGKPVMEVLSGYSKVPAMAHFWSLLGGFAWSVGTCANAVAGLSFASQAYAIGQCAGVMSILWGVFVWKEFAGTDGKVSALIGLVLLLFIGGIVLIVLSS